jgi:hypothetical protein
LDQGTSTSTRLSDRQESHIARLTMTASLMLEAKYRKGAAEHGDTLLDMTPLELCDNLIEEALDQLNFALTLRSALLAGKSAGDCQ